MTDLTIRPAEHDNDVIAIHGFLCVVAGPTLPGHIDPKASIEEVWRVVNQDCALMAVSPENKLVGTLGIVRGKFWWNPAVEFLANRWFFALPGMGAGKLLLDEAERIAVDAGMELHILDETKGRLVILNKSPMRKQFNPFMTPPEHIGPPAHVTRH